MCHLILKKTSAYLCIVPFAVALALLFRVCPFPFRRVLALLSCFLVVALGERQIMVASPTHTVVARPEQTIVTPTLPGPTPPFPAASRPVLAFYYMWYHQLDWSLSKMSDLPTIRYTSSDEATIDRQLTWAANAGITGFISSWWGPSSQTDRNFVKLLAHSASLERRTHQDFTSSVYFECDSPALTSISDMVNGLQYLSSHYTNDPHYFHWQGKPVIFFWKPFDHGRTLAQWAAIRREVDPHRQVIWSAEGANLSVLPVFDGIHLFSAGYWGLVNHTMPAVDLSFRTHIDAYNRAHNGHRIWAAGVEPGYDDTHLAGRAFTYRLLRDNGSLYRTSWMAALASNPDWITITTFNEWFEGAMIEPSVTYGEQYLTLTQQFIRQWRDPLPTTHP